MTKENDHQKVVEVIDIIEGRFDEFGELLPGLERFKKQLYNEIAEDV